MFSQNAPTNDFLFSIFFQNDKFIPSYHMSVKYCLLKN